MGVLAVLGVACRASAAPPVEPQAPATDAPEPEPATQSEPADPDPVEPSDHELHLAVYIRKDTVTVSGHGIEEVTIPLDHAALHNVAVEAKTLFPTARDVTIRADDDVPMQHLVDVMATLAGECDPQGEGPECLFPAAVVEAPGN